MRRLEACAGLDLETDTIIEVACIITDGELENLVEVGLARCGFSAKAPVRIVCDGLRAGSIIIDDKLSFGGAEPGPNAFSAWLLLD